MASSPLDIFQKLIEWSILSPRGPKPGALVQSLNKADRAVLEGLTSDDINKARIDLYLVVSCKCFLDKEGKRSTIYCKVCK